MLEDIVIRLPEFIQANAHLLQPPVCNKMIHNDGALRVMVVGGPNVRKDYHLNLGEELFYQLRGNMVLKVMESGQPKDIVIKEGDMFVLPARIPHSPQRFENTIGLVIERARNPTELDGLRYYVDATNSEILWERFFPVTNLGKQLVPLIEEFFSSEEYKTRQPSKPIPLSAWAEDEQTILSSPFQLSSRFLNLADDEPPLHLFKKDFQVLLLGGESRTPPLPLESETWVWILKGEAEVNGKRAVEGDTVLCTTALSSICLPPVSRVLLVYSVV